MKKGFTLAEILLTLSIVGIVAVLTVPAIVNTTNDSQYKSSYKSGFTTLSQAVSTVASKNGGLQSICTGDWCLYDLIKAELKTVLECGAGTSSTEGCWSTSQTHLDGTAATDYGANASYKGLLLNNGMSFLVNTYVSACSGTVGGKNLCSTYWIDTNGPKSPNVLGKDIFRGAITPDGMLYPTGNNGWNDGEESITQGWTKSWDYLYKP